MRPQKVLIKKELKTISESWVLYVLYGSLLIIIGFIGWFSYDNIFNSGELSLSVLFNRYFVALFFIIPFLTMKSFSLERLEETIELLATKPVTLANIIGGKFWSSFILVAAFLTLTIICYISLSFLSHIDHAVGFCGYLALFMTACCYISMGLFSSTLTTSPFYALLITFGITVWFQFLFEYLAGMSGGFLMSFFNYLSMGDHFDTLSRGVIDSRDIIYYFSITVLFLALTWNSVRKINNPERL